MKKINDLPPEILRKCFRSLSPPDLKSSVLVSEDWRAVGEDPSLWTWCKVTIRNREDLNKLSVRRMRKVQKIRIEPGGNWEAGDWEALLQAVASKELPQFEELILGCRHLSTEQMTSILTRISQEDIKLKKLTLEGPFINQRVCNFEAEVLAKVMIKLEEVNLCSNWLSVEQLTSILTRIAQEDTKLKKLNLSENYLSDVEPEVLAQGLVRLEEVNLWYINTEQITSILTRIAQEDIKLKKLNLYGNDLSDVEPEVLARGLTKLEEANLGFTDMRTQQMTSILKTIAREDTKLKKLDLHGNDLSDVEREALVRAVVKLEEVDLRNTNLISI